ncbi:ribosome biosynthesis protein [Nowakowskiella sp. JEL0407]|nr:ribosome biosynthesis protein [Nowakowskiella sp. JEL0407]
MVARGHYNVKSKFVDDDGHVYLEFNWSDEVHPESLRRAPLTVLLCRSSGPPSTTTSAPSKQSVCYLFVKTIERAHMPSKLWEKIKLSRNYATALEQIDTELIYWPKFMIHKNKQRLTKITQYLIRMRKLKLKTKAKVIGVAKKVERREARREIKAETAARLEQSIEKELLDRLRKGLYPDGIVNESQGAFSKALDMLEDENEEEYEEEEELDEDVDEEFTREFVSDVSEDEDDLEDFDESQFGSVHSDDDDEEEEESDEDETLSKKRKPKGPPAKGKRGKKSYVEVEYEREHEQEQNVARSGTW